MNTPYNVAKQEIALSQHNVTGSVPVTESSHTALDSLSLNQRSLLLWMAQGHTFQISDHRTSRKLFSIHLEDFDGKYDKRTTARLLEAGYIDFRAEVVLMVNWQIYFITKAGRVAAKKLMEV